MTCGSRLHWYDMVPVFSWLILGGKCRNCKTKISAQYPVIEALNGTLYVLVCAVNGLNGMSAIYCLMTSALIVLSLIDWRTYEIPISVNVFLGILGIAAVVVQPEAWMTHLVGALCVSGILLVIYLVSGGRAIGGGDVKLMAVCGLLLGWELIIFAFLLGCIIGSVIHLIRMKVSGEGHVLAMGPYLSAGVAIAVLWGNEFLQWYLNFYL